MVVGVRARSVTEDGRDLRFAPYRRAGGSLVFSAWPMARPTLGSGAVAAAVRGICPFPGALVAGSCVAGARGYIDDADEAEVVTETVQRTWVHRWSWVIFASRD